MAKRCVYLITYTSRDPSAIKEGFLTLTCLVGSRRRLKSTGLRACAYDENVRDFMRAYEEFEKEEAWVRGLVDSGHPFAHCHEAMAEVQTEDKKEWITIRHQKIS